MASYGDPEIPSSSSTGYSYTSRARNDIYSLGLLTHRAGYPIYMPTPSRALPAVYQKNGIRIGDVGRITANGSFDFLFNVCQADVAAALPDNFEPLEPIMSIEDKFSSGTCLSSEDVIEIGDRIGSPAFQCSGDEGAVLVLPTGATIYSAMNLLHFQKLSSRHAIDWYKYALDSGRDISNGSLYLITECTKSANWGTAVFYPRRTEHDKLQFIFDDGLCRWERRGKIEAKSGPGPKDIHVSDDEEPNQCVFLRGYKIMLRADIWDKLRTDAGAMAQGGTFSSLRSSGVRVTSRSSGVAVQAQKPPLSTERSQPREVVLEDYFNDDAPLHPSDLINIMLLHSKPEATVALVHDSDWCDHLPQDFIADPANPNVEGLLGNIRQSYKAVVDEHDSVVLLNTLNVTPDKTLPALPPDLLEHVLLQLDGKDVISCSLISRQFNIFIRSSIVLQYRIACHAAGVVDNSHCKLSYPERHEALLKRENAWRTLQPVFTKTFDVLHVPSSFYDLTSGVYCSGDVGRQDVHYCSLPSTPEDILQWNTIYGHGPNRNWDGAIVDMGMAIYEHDLIVNIISSPLLNAPLGHTVHSLSMILLQFSTGGYHPLAHSPQIYIEESLQPDPDIVLEISGNNIAVVNVNTLFIFDWKTGHKRLQVATEDEYSGLVFISPEILVVPNFTQARFEVWKIHKDTSIAPHLILNLLLPTLSEEYFISHIRCHSEPNPHLHDVPNAPHRSFHPSVCNAIIVSNVTASRIDAVGLDVDFTLVMHRQSLLDTIAHLPYSVVLGFGSGSGTLGEYSIPWSVWGPPISRWFHEDEARVGWITSSAGQRWAVLDPVDDTKSRIRVFDFNPYNIYNVPDDFPGEVVKKGDYYFDHDDVFAEDIKMGLGCIAYTTPETYDFDEVLMEEERLLGLKINNGGQSDTITVFYFG